MMNPDEKKPIPIDTSLPPLNCVEFVIFMLSFLSLVSFASKDLIKVFEYFEAMVDAIYLTYYVLVF